MPADRDRALAPGFSLGAFLVDETFPELAAELDPSDLVIAQLERLAAVLEALEGQFPGGWTVRSGYRDARLNDACRERGLPASVESLHLLGCAADIAPAGEQDLEAVFDWIGAPGHHGLDLQEAVYYPNKGFIHVAVPHPEFERPRRFIMRV